MSDTLPSFELTGVDWQNLNTLSGVAAGTALSIQNQSADIVTLAVAAAKPALGFKGVVLPSSAADIAYVEAGANIVWGFGFGPVNVQAI